MIPGSFGKWFQNFGDLLKLTQDEDFRKFLANPKVQTLMENEGFKRAIQEKNISKLMANPEFSEILSDPEVRTALEGMQMKFGKAP